MTDRGRLAGKVALITGATSGIGEATARAFAREGAGVAVAGIDAEQGERVVADLRAAGTDAVFIAADVRSEVQVQAMVEHTCRHFGALDVLVANAGIGARDLGDGPAHTCTLDAWDAVMNVNLRGTFLCCRAALPALLQRRGSIVSVSSVLGMVGTQGMFDTHAYAASKAGLIGPDPRHRGALRPGRRARQRDRAWAGGNPHGPPHQGRPGPVGRTPALAAAGRPRRHLGRGPGRGLPGVG